MSGTTVTFIGLLIAAFGGIIAFVGQRMSATEDSQRPNAKLEAIAKDLTAAKQDLERIKGTPASAEKQTQTTEAEKKITAVESRLQTWAENLASQSKKAEHKSSVLESEAEGLRISNKVRPLFQFAIDTVSEAITAYSAKSKSQIKAQIPSLPVDLFSDEAQKYKGVIVFAPNAAWEIRFSAVRPPRKTNQLNLRISFGTKPDGIFPLGDTMTIWTDGSAETVMIWGEGEHFGYLPDPKRLPFSDSKPAIESAVLGSLERQLLDTQQ